ncbi:SDR family oxidoreductase [Salipiger thiooxidans]|uniref:SDR family oxidoreductase n=1 Tax=Salipiger thiooxidans TaxID=282683 RepID=UPI001A8F9478|nr:SDR family oxidoreductase [Salipiger thiooxidans]
MNRTAPGRLESRPIHERLHPTQASREACIAAHIPAGRFGAAEEGAAVICFLASASARCVRGVTLPVDGGTVRRSFCGDRVVRAG